MTFRGPLSGVAAFSVALVVGCWAPQSQASDEGPRERAGLAVGLHGSGALGNLQGYPNDPVRIDRPKFYSDTGAAAGFVAGGWIGVALSDFLVCGISGSGSMLGGGEVATHAWMAGLHLSVFPLAKLSHRQHWARPLGLELDVGLGRALGHSMADDGSLADTGVGSHVQVGFAYEGFHLGPLRLGPMISTDVVFSPVATRAIVALGFRTTFYSAARRGRRFVDPG